MALTLDWILVCDYGLIDGQSGRPSLLNLIDVAVVHQFPTGLPILTAMMRFTGEPHSATQIVVDWLTPDGGVWMMPSIGVVAFSASSVTYLSIQVSNVLLSQSGAYLLRVSGPNGLLRQTDLRVVLQSTPPATPQVH